MMQDFDLLPDNQSFHVYVKYPDEEPRYIIDWIKMDCTCMGFTIEQAKAVKENREAKYCKHLEEVRFRVRHASIKLGMFKITEDI